MSSISDRISLIIRELCDANNSVFARRINTSEANVRNYTNGTQPKFEVLAKIANEFEINCEWLLLGKGKMINSEKKGIPKCIPECIPSDDVSEKTDKIEEKPEPIIIYQRDPRDIEIIELQRNHIKLLNEKMSGDFFDGGAGSEDFAPAAPDVHTTSRHPAQFNDPTRHRN